MIHQANQMKYAVITPARNEEAFIELVIQSMIAQTIKPEKWVIVSDGSTDKTDDIVKKYLADHPWMELERMPEHRDRQFAAKVHAFNAGYARLGGITYEIIGNLDADITFDETYFEFLLGKFAEDPKRGVIGTPFVENGVHYDYKFTNIEHVSGACQMFRKECFDQIGGYQPIKGGGIDWTAVTTARMMGWCTQTFTEKVCYHHRKMGTGNAGNYLTWYRHGKKDYFLGGHPLWQVFRTIYQMRHRPFVIGGALLFLGYFTSFVTGAQKSVSAQLMAFHRKEQMQRLRCKFKFG